MKKIFLLAAILFAIQSFSQQPYYDFKKFKDSSNKDGVLVPLDLNKRSQNISRDSLAKILKELEHRNYSSSFGELVFTHPNGNKVYILPQDNMPCLVPDLSQFNMPVVGRGIRITGMPPGSVPRKPYFPQKNK